MILDLKLKPEVFNMIKHKRYPVTLTISLKDPRIKEILKLKEEYKDCFRDWSMYNGKLKMISNPEYSDNEEVVAVFAKIMDIAEDYTSR
jgi:hypothetical protein